MAFITAKKEKIQVKIKTFITIARECKTFGELAESFKVTPKITKFRFNNLYVKKNQNF